MPRDLTVNDKAEVLPILLSLEIGAFPYCISADAAAAFTSRNIPNLNQYRREQIRSLYKKTRIDERYFAIPDFLNRAEATVLSVPLAQRFEQAATTVTPLVLQVVARALDAAEMTADNVAQILVVTSTAFNSPGLESTLISYLGLRPNVMHAAVNYMGCGAGIVGLRWASDFVKGLSGMRQHQVSLLVCVEASSLHAAIADDHNSLVTHALFSDGVACAVVAARSPSEPSLNGRLAITDFESYLVAGTDDGIRLRMNPEVIECLLSPRLPEAITHGVKRWFDSLLRRNKTTKEDIRFFAIHPGGPKIIEACLKGLNLPEDTASFSWHILRSHGNTLSCGVFYVLRSMLDHKAITPGDIGIAFSFSPGVSVEGVLLRALPDPQCSDKQLCL